MKQILVACACALFAATLARAEFKMPKSVYRLDQMEKAKAEAESKGRAITVILSQEKTTCPLCSASSMNAADVLGKKTVVLYADFETDWQKLPAAIQSAMNLPALGKYIPKTVIMDAALTNVLALVPYALGAEQKRLLNDAIKKLSVLPAKPTSAAKAASAAQALTIPPADDRESRTWRPATGAPIDAVLVQERAGMVTLKMKDGGKIELLSTSLGKDDQSYLQKLRPAVTGTPDASAKK